MFCWEWKGKKIFLSSNFNTITWTTFLYRILKNQGLPALSSDFQMGVEEWGGGERRESEGLWQLEKVCYGFTSKWKAIRAVLKMKHKLLTAQVFFH